MTIEAFVTTLEARLGKVFTEEQKDFIMNLDTPGMCFASPGTGKTASAVAGLLLTELYKQIPGENIYALSFTNMATLELAVRHEDACKQLGVRQNVNFKTLHKLCSSILRENHKLLDMETMETTSTFSIESLASGVIGYCQEQNIDLAPRNVRNVIRAVRTLNSSLTFTRTNVESRLCFKDTGLSYEDFMSIRKVLYDYNKLIEKIQVDDILLYTLELLLRHPEVATEFKKKCRVLLVDEAQDLSLLQLRIITLLSDCPVLIGDIKQQIYAFNGACQEIVGQYYKYYPNGWKKELNRSFRCKHEIADFATKLITPNHVGGEDFKGNGYGGVVDIMNGFDYADVCKSINDEYLANNRNFPKGILFLFRNNYSAIPIAEEFFKLKTPFRVNRYTPVTQMPIIKDLCAIVELALQPNSLDNLPALNFLIPEFRTYETIKDNPFYRTMVKKYCSIYDVKYSFKDAYCGERVLSMLLEVSDMCKGTTKVTDIFNTIYPLYREYWLYSREQFMEYDATYYFRLANFALHNKTYQQFRKDELDKYKFIEDCNLRRIGVRCYTFHAAKGLEDDIVYMLDCDEDIIPNKKKSDEMLRKHCELELAREIRNERSLVYVASTRAKDELHIRYNTSLSSLLTEHNYYQQYDMMYESFKPDYNDVLEFQKFYAGEHNG